MVKRTPRATDLAAPAAAEQRPWGEVIEEARALHAAAGGDAMRAEFARLRAEREADRNAWDAAGDER